MKLLQRIVDRTIARAMRTPYFHIVGIDGSEYMRRYWLLRPRKWCPISIRVHHILRSDDDRALHDHPFHYCSIILRGGYVEVRPAKLPNGPRFGLNVSRWHGAGSVLFRPASSAHRLEILHGGEAWSLFIMSRKVRTWGFWTPYGWCPWDEYLAPDEVAQQRAEHAKLGMEEPA